MRYICLVLKGWSQCFLRKNIERKSLILISYINWRYIIERIQMFNNYKYCRADIIRVVKWIIWLNYSITYSFIFLSNQIFLRSLHLNSAWIINKQFWRSCGIFGSNQSVIIIFYPPSVSRSSSTSLIFHSARRPFPSTSVEYSPGEGEASLKFICWNNTRDRASFK